jgi:hypothetical protein
MQQAQDSDPLSRRYDWKTYEGTNRHRRGLVFVSHDAGMLNAADCFRESRSRLPSATIADIVGCEPPQPNFKDDYLRMGQMKGFCSLSSTHARLITRLNCS